MGESAKSFKINSMSDSGTVGTEELIGIGLQGVDQSNPYGANIVLLKSEVKKLGLYIGDRITLVLRTE